MPRWPHLSLAAAAVCFCCAIADAASISGKITPAEKVAKVFALSRKSTLSGKGALYKQKNKFPEFKGAFNKATGEFTIPNLKNGRYDLVIELKGGGRIEGYHLRLAREFRRDAELTDKMKQKLWKDIDSMLQVDAFCNKRRVLAFEGNGEFVNALVEKARTREFHSDKGEAIYRIETWILVNYTGSWKHHQLGNVTYYRLRMPKDKFVKMLWLFDRKLGGIRISRGKSVKGFEYQIPASWDKCRGMGKTPGYIFDEPLK